MKQKSGTWSYWGPWHVPRNRIFNLSWGYIPTILNLLWKSLCCPCKLSFTQKRKPNWVDLWIHKHYDMTIIQAYDVWAEPRSRLDKDKTKTSLSTNSRASMFQPNEQACEIGLLRKTRGSFYSSYSSKCLIDKVLRHGTYRNSVTSSFFSSIEFSKTVTE